MDADNKEFEPEGMMFVGDKGKILGGFHCENPRLIPERKSRDYWSGKGEQEPSAPRERQFRLNNSAWIKAFKGGERTYGDFLLAGPISEAFSLGAISLRLGGKRLRWDAEAMKMTNLPEANRYLVREYRKGWELTA
jgi:hypothetical protein